MTLKHVAWGIVGILVGTGIVALLCVSVVRTLPGDFFLVPLKTQPWDAKRVGRNLLGWLLVLGGLIMMFTPGQGLLTLVVGLAIADYPGKQRILWKVATIRTLRQALDKVRGPAGGFQWKESP